MNVYLDLDGVLLTDDRLLAPYADEFLHRVINNSTYWLTTWCKGDATRVLAILKPLVSTETYDVLLKVKPTDWQTSKLEAIDFALPFRWYDDEPMRFEIDELRECGLIDSWIKVDLLNNPDHLRTL